MLWGLPGIGFVFSWWLPAATQITFLTGSVLSLIQAAAFRNPRVRSLLGITPLYMKPTARPQTIQTRFAVPPRPRPKYEAPTSAKEKANGTFEDLVGKYSPAALSRFFTTKEQKQKEMLAKQAAAYEAQAAARRAAQQEGKRRR